ncbi:phage tail assembly chaperone [Pseudomonas sp. JL2]|nr:phage tail assembly chaperone [Pseudomonas sp. JL2]
MGLYSSKAFNGFFDDSINETIPDDAKVITLERRDELLAGQSQGKFIDFSHEDGPVLIDPPPTSPEVLAAIERRWRDERLLETDGIVSRHRDELEGGVTTTLTAEQYTELQAYRQSLRNWPESGQFPLAEHRPETPSWLAIQPQ